VLPGIGSGVKHPAKWRAKTEKAGKPFYKQPFLLKGTMDETSGFRGFFPAILTPRFGKKDP
jgi:hypothetical protein